MKSVLGLRLVALAVVCVPGGSAHSGHASILRSRPLKPPDFDSDRSDGAHIPAGGHRSRRTALRSRTLHNLSAHRQTTAQKTRESGQVLSVMNLEVLDTCCPRSTTIGAPGSGKEVLDHQPFATILPLLTSMYSWPLRPVRLARPCRGYFNCTLFWAGLVAPSTSGSTSPPPTAPPSMCLCGVYFCQGLQVLSVLDGDVPRLLHYRLLRHHQHIKRTQLVDIATMAPRPLRRAPPAVLLRPLPASATVARHGTRKLTGDAGIVSLNGRVPPPIVHLRRSTQRPLGTRHATTHGACSAGPSPRCPGTAYAAVARSPTRPSWHTSIDFSRATAAEGPSPSGDLRAWRAEPGWSCGLLDRFYLAEHDTARRRPTGSRLKPPTSRQQRQPAPPLHDRQGTL